MFRFEKLDVWQKSMNWCEDVYLVTRDFPAEEIVSTLSAQLSWSHFVELMSLKDDLQVQFYAEMCRVERWSARPRAFGWSSGGLRRDLW